MKKIVFSHGKESGPWGSKIKHLANIASAMGYSVESMDYTRTENPEERVSMLEQHFESAETNELVLVGSSMGGYVSTVYASQHSIKALFLMAPALYMPNYSVQHYKPQCEQVTILHGWHDEVIPVDNALRFAKENRCTLHIVKGDHRLNDCLPLVGELFTVFLRRLEQRNVLNERSPGGN